MKILKNALLIVTLCLILSCQKENVKPYKSPESIENKIFAMSEFYSQYSTDSLALKTIPGFIKLKAGQNQVFKRTYKSPDDTKIADEEYTEYVYFQRLADNVPNFIIENEAINNTNFYYHKSCYCIYEINQKVVGGKIQGSFINGKWNVNLDVQLKSYYGFNNVISDSSIVSIKFVGDFTE